MSEVFRFEKLGLELITRALRVFFRNMEIGELNAEELRELPSAEYFCRHTSIRTLM